MLFAAIDRVGHLLAVLANPASTCSQIDDVVSSMPMRSELSGDRDV